MAKRNFDINDQEIIVRTSRIETFLVGNYDNYFNEIGENFNLVAGHILSEADFEKLFGERRPTYQSNLFMPVLMKIAGDFKSNLPAVDFLPRHPDDQDKAAVIKELNNWTFYQKNDIDYELSKAYLFSLICRRMWMKQDFNYDRDPEGSITISCHHPFLKTDSHKDRDLHDCQFISDSLWLTIDEIITIYAAQDEELARTLRQRKIDLFGDETNKSAFKKFFNYLEKLVGRDVKYLGEKSGYDSRKIWTENGLINDKQGFWHNNGRFRTIDLYHREQFPTMKITDRILQKQMDFTDVVKHKDGDPVSESDTWYNNDKLQHVLSNLPDPDAIVREGFTNKIVQSSVCPGLQLVLYDGLAQLQNKEADFKFTKLDCYDFHPDMLETRSVVDNIKDSVKSFNKRNNTLLEYLLRATHLEYLISDKYKNKVPDMTANKVGQVRFLPDSMMQDGDHAFRRIEPPQRDLAIEKFMESDFNLIDKLSGVNDNSKGIPQGENSGRLFIARAEASESMQSWITENGQSALTEIARKDIFYFQTFLTERRVIRLLDDSQKPNWLVINDQDPYGNVLNDITIGEFDVIISKVAVGKIAKAMEDQRDLQIIDLSGNIPGMETVSKILIRDVISRNNLSTKNEIIPIINQLIQLDMMKIQQVLNPTPQPDPNQVQPPTDPELAQLAKLKAATDIHKGMLANQGQQLDNAEKKVNIASLLSDHAANHLKNMNMIHKLITPQPVQQQ